MFTSAHREAARGADALECPNCHCEAATRIKKDWSSRLQYGRPQAFEKISRPDAVAAVPEREPI